MGRFKDWVIQHAIKHEYSCPDSAHQNGRAERQWRTFFNLVRCVLIKSGAPKFLWTYALKYCVYVRNRCFNSRTGKTPFESMTGICPNINRLEIFGAKCFAYVQNKRKLDDRAKQGVFVGFDTSSPAYLVYFPEERTVRKIRCVAFNQRTKLQSSPNDHLDNGENDDEELMYTYPPQYFHNNDDSIYEDSVAIEDDENLHTGPQVTEGRLDKAGRGRGAASNQPADASVPAERGRYPSRLRKPPVHLRDYATEGDTSDDDVTAANSFSVDYCYKMSFIPKNYNQAVKCENSGDWCNAMDDEMNSLTENKTFELTTLPPDRNCISGRWVYSVKPGINNEPKFKARYCAKGFNQQYDVDYKETFAPTCRMTSVRMLLQFSIQNGMTVHQVDASSAFLHADIECDLYVQQPRGYVQYDKCGNELVMKLNKSLYGLKQSSRNWNNCLNDFFISQNFKRSYSDPCLYSKFHNDSCILVLVHVDDMLISCSLEKDLISFKNTLSNSFKIKDLGILNWYLGIEFKHSKNFISMSQENFVQKVLEKFNMQDAKTKSLPCDVGFNKFDCQESKPLENPTLFRAIIGSLVYIMTCTRPDISYVVTRLSQYMDKPNKAHLALAKDVLRYLKGTISQTLTFHKSRYPLHLHGYSDSDYAGSENRKSTSGHCFKLTEGSALISWKTKKQSVVSLSSCEAEYNAISHAVQEGKFLRQLFADMQNLATDKFDLFVDNQGAIKLANNHMFQQRTKHVEVKYHFVKSEIQRGTVDLCYVESSKNLADMFTKALSRARSDGFNYRG